MTKPTSVSIPEHVKQKAREAAQKEGRSLSNWVARTIAEKLNIDPNKKAEV